MYTQDRYSKIKRKKSKKAVSEIIGYVLLVSFAIIISIVVYKWMKTYVPQEEINCPSGVSLFIDSYTLNEDTLVLNLRNNGKFNVGGYFIYATDSPAKELATIDLSSMNVDPTSRLNPLGVKFGTYASGDQNTLAPNDMETDSYNITSISEGIYSVEIVPIRWQTQDRKMILVSCKDAKIREEIQNN